MPKLTETDIIIHDNGTITFPVTVPAVWRVKSKFDHVDNDMIKFALTGLGGRALCHGIKQKENDAATGSEKPDNWTDTEKALDNGEYGKGAENPAKLACAQRQRLAMRDQLLAGVWALKSVRPGDPYGEIRKQIRDYLRGHGQVVARAQAEDVRITNAFLDDVFDGLGDKPRNAVIEIARKRWAEENDADLDMFADDDETDDDDVS